MPTASRQRFEGVFTIQPWRLGADSDIVVLAYDVAGETFVERISLPFPIDPDGPARALLDLLAAVAGVSYFKAFAPTSIEAGFELSAEALAVVAAAYDHGLREFAHQNGFDVPFRTRIDISEAASPSSPTRPSAATFQGRPLLPFGGGKDSSLLASAIADTNPILFTLGDNPYVGRVADALGLELAVGTRSLDPRILRSRDLGYLNGHVPVTAVNSLISLVLATAVYAGAVVMANERSASMDTIPGINHQYSKSLDFERLLRAALPSGAPAYFSALRPWGDLAIARAFATRTSMLPNFMSCNRAFVRAPAQRSAGWCGSCDKCRSVFLSIAPFVEPDALVDVFGRNLLDDDYATFGFRRLVQPSDKPFDCVADVDEARQAIWLLNQAPAWRRTAVVRALVAEGFTTEPGADTFAAVGDHFVPDSLYVRLSEQIFG